MYVSGNCQICGSECLGEELHTITISGFDALEACNSCLKKTAEEHFKDSVDLLNEIVLIAKTTSGNPERRLRAIKALIK